MNFDEEMELALLEMKMHPAFLEKMMDDNTDNEYGGLTFHEGHQCAHQRPTRW